MTRVGSMLLRAKRSVWVPIVSGLAASVYVMSPVAFPPSVATPVDRELLLARQRKARSYSWLYTLSLAIQGYRVDNNGFLPYHDEGAEEALYLLKPYALPEFAPSQPKDAEMFGAQNPDNDMNGPAFFDDVNHAVRNADYDLINLKNLKELVRYQNQPNRLPGEPSLIILAEKTGVRRNSKRYVTLSRQVGEYHFAAGEPVDIVGKSLRSLRAARRPAQEQ